MKFIPLDYEAEAKRILDSDHTGLVVSDPELAEAIVREARRRGLTHTGSKNYRGEYLSLADVEGINPLWVGGRTEHPEWTFQPPPPPWHYDQTKVLIYRDRYRWALVTRLRHHHDGRVELLGWASYHPCGDDFWCDNRYNDDIHVESQWDGKVPGDPQ